MKPHNIWRITIDTNPEDCNLSCIMCEEHSPFSNYISKNLNGKHRRMPENWLEPIFQQAKELGVKEIIPSTMGEPLIYKYFNRIVELCYQYDIKMNLTTNGTFPKISGKTTTEWAKLIVPITTDVKISWNGATQETSEKVMKRIDFEKTVQNVKEFVAVRNAHYATTGYFCRITFQLTFMQNNMHELAEIIKLAASLDIDRVKGHQLWTHFEETKDLSFRKDANSIKQWNEYVEQAHIAQENHRKPNGEKIILENIIPLQKEETKEVPDVYECPFLNKELWISATGKISPCCAPDELRNGLGDFGNFQNQTILEAIESDNYQELLDNYKAIDLCKTCNMRKPVEEKEKNVFKNFRDIAMLNLTFKPNQIFRSGTLTDYEKETSFEQILKAKNIGTVIDFRAAKEIEKDPYHHSFFQYIHAPFNPWNQSKEFREKHNKGTNVEIAYQFFIIECKASVKKTMEAIINSNQSIVLHCQHGKDRTGIIVALLGLLVESSKQVILKDYLASKMDLIPAYLAIVFDRIEEEGGIIAYLESCDLSIEQIKILKQKIRR